MKMFRKNVIKRISKMLAMRNPSNRVPISLGHITKLCAYEIYHIIKVDFFIVLYGKFEWIKIKYTSVGKIYE